jgi:hypothetical protein
LSEERRINRWPTKPGSIFASIIALPGNANRPLEFIYPDVSLKEARDGREEARKMLENDFDFGRQGKVAKAARMETAENSFQSVALEWFAKCQHTWHTPEPSKLFKLRAWLTVPEALERLAIVFGEESPNRKSDFENVTRQKLRSLILAFLSGKEKACDSLRLRSVIIVLWRQG